LGIDQGFPHEGMAEYSDLAVDQNTGTYLIRGVVPNPDRRIPPGAFARVRVPRGKIEALLIDPGAVGHDQSGPYLLVVNDEETIERRSIELAGKYEGLQAIQGAITPEDRVVVQGLQRARPGAKVLATLSSAASTKASKELAVAPVVAPVPQTDQQLPPAATPTEE
jgi:membrane fusion protein (multidrug efflux system)